MAKKKAVKKKVRVIVTPALPARERMVHYTVALADPKMVRKDVLEALREIIIFMQGYETFRKIQEEKVTTFQQLRTKIRELNSLIENRLRKQLPKGKLKPDAAKQEHPSMPHMEQPRVEKEELPVAEKEEEGQGPYELDALEKQLQDVEQQLKNFGS
ncbi:hypothetical protein HYX14_02220 [Candidatus Woesearchaeota archaeon]|nr:hypothetical protein [Candidatus Woesearchaeota archaeon]